MAGLGQSGSGYEPPPGATRRLLGAQLSLGIALHEDAFGQLAQVRHRMHLASLPLLASVVNTDAGNSMGQRHSKGLFWSGRSLGHVYSNDGDVIYIWKIRRNLSPVLLKSGNQPCEPYEFTTKGHTPTSFIAPIYKHKYAST